MRPNPLTDDLTAEAKAELAAEFAELKHRYPPVRIEHLGGITFARAIQAMPWQRRGW